jgi:hypothetical protein
MPSEKVAKVSNINNNNSNFVQSAIYSNLIFKKIEVRKS